MTSRRAVIGRASWFPVGATAAAAAAGAVAEAAAGAGTGGEGPAEPPAAR